MKVEGKFKKGDNSVGAFKKNQTPSYNRSRGIWILKCQKK